MLTKRSVSLVVLVISMLALTFVIGGVPTTLQAHCFAYTFLGLWAIAVPVKYCLVCRERDTVRDDLSLQRETNHAMVDIVKRNQTLKRQAVTISFAARNRTKHFVDILNVLSNEPLSRRKREAFFKEARERGLHHALYALECKYGKLFLKDEGKEEDRAEALRQHRALANEVREYILVGNAGTLKGSRG